MESPRGIERSLLYSAEAQRGRLAGLRPALPPQGREATRFSLCRTGNVAMLPF